MSTIIEVFISCIKIVQPRPQNVQENLSGIQKVPPKVSTKQYKLYIAQDPHNDPHYIPREN